MSKYNISKILTKEIHINKSKQLFLGTFLVIFLIIIGTRYSYAYLKTEIDTGKKVNVIVGTLDYNLSNNRITIPALNDIKVKINVESLNNTNSKYGIYYNFITDLTSDEKSKVNIYSYLNSSSFAEDIINKNGMTEVELILTNELDKDVEISLGVKGGFVYNDLEITEGTPIVEKIDETYKLKVARIVSAAENYYSSNQQKTTLTLPDNNSLLSLTNNDIEGTIYIKSDGRVAFQGLNNNKCLVKRYDNSYTEVLTNNNDICSKNIYSNLVINGYGEYGNNYNFSAFTYDSVNNQFKVDLSSGKRITITADLFTPVDVVNKKYKISVDMHQMYNDDFKYYAGFREYDIDKKYITAQTVMYLEDTLTKLAQDLNDGDTVVYFDDLTNWNVNTSVRSYQRGFIFWNYKDGAGYQYPPLTYSRNFIDNLYQDVNVNKENNSITLDSPWRYGTFKAGTEVSQSNSGNTYNYSLGINSIYESSNNYQTISNMIEGTNYNNSSVTSFRIPTKFISIGIILNSFDESQTIDDGHFYMKNIIFEEVEQ